MAQRAARHRSVPGASMPRASTSRRVVRGVAAGVVGLLVATGVSGALIYRHYTGQIHRVAGALNTTDPHIRHRAQQLSADNFLVIGSDTRAGSNSAFGDVGGARSDTTMLVHLSPDRSRAVVISVPRDAWLPIPACQDAAHHSVPAHTGQFNSAFTEGGARCTVETVQQLTGISITHYVQVDFSGFTSIVSALGGVTICSPEAVHDPNSTLTLKAGQNTLSPSQALAYVRAREALGDGSDLGRIQRQQRFLGAVLREARGGHLLRHLPSFLDAATKSLTLDPGTSLLDLKRMIDVLRGLDPSRVTFYTAPIANPAYNPDDPSQPGGRVLLDAASGRRLYDSVIDDATQTVTPPAASTPSPTPSPTRSTTRAPAPLTVTVAPADITVAVTNGVGSPELATHVQQALSGVGFRPGVLGLEPQGATTTTVLYAPSQLAAARTVAAAIPGAVLRAEAQHTGDIEVIIGTAYRGVTPVHLGQRLPSGLQPSGTGSAPGTPPSSGTGASTPGASSGPKPAPLPRGLSAADTSCTE